MSTPHPPHEGPRRWAEVDGYLADLFALEDVGLAQARQASDAAGLPPIAVSPAQGKLLHLLARLRGARRILEIGTLGGYSTIWLARALPPDGRLVTLEARAEHAEVARANLARAGLADRVEVRVGAALTTLPDLAAEGGEPFDLIFIDADKGSNAAYLEWSLKLGRPGTLVILDNVVADGAVVDADDTGERTEGIRRGLEFLGREPRLDATAVQTVGAKGYDGFALALIT
ncbi:methyltransferase [Streptomyces sp. NRRL F-4489]|uniref:O-methyltransferase n=1 Tax=Streptomyces sp. NRRL F-4489 TaxID=1609095 RepID=UPI0007497821|nr:O-methyltransferase [Streptomyces sp. NRRL F-4489]KUL46068.1 methyltransferase [Streptomyces sp. NRRL F-4489]